MTTEKKHIAILINTLLSGGAERAVSNLSMQLADRYDIDIILNNDRQINYPYRGRIISLGMPADKQQTDPIIQLTALNSRRRKLISLKKTQNYSAVISFSE